MERDEEEEEEKDKEKGKDKEKEQEKAASVKGFSFFSWLRDQLWKKCCNGEPWEQTY